MRAPRPFPLPNWTLSDNPSPSSRTAIEKLSTAVVATLTHTVPGSAP